MSRYRDDLARIVPLAWPVLIGQLAVLAFSTIDTLVIARYDSVDLAALAVGAAAHITIFVGFMGTVLAIGPIAGQLFGAGRDRDAGDALHQAVWLALGASAIGCVLLALPQPFLWLAHSTPEVETRIRSYLLGLAAALPAALLFTAFRGFSVAVSRPKPVMVLQLGALGLKLPLTIALVHGIAPLGLPALGIAGCGIATAIAVWLQLVGVFWVLRRGPAYARFALFGRGLHAPRAATLRALLRLGIPTGLSITVEVTAFTFMAFFIARLGPTPVAGHQIAMNVVSLMFMLPLALAQATSTLVAQRIGAGDLFDARKLGWHGLQFGITLSGLLGAAVFLGRGELIGLYTADAAVAAATLPLLAWTALFLPADSAQTIAAFVLRAWHIAKVPMFIYAGALWGVGLIGGYALAFDLGGGTPAWLRGAPGFWFAATAGLVFAAFALAAYLIWLQRRMHTGQAAAVAH